MTNEEVEMDLSAMDDSPVLWIRLDPDFTLIRSVDIRQPDFQWQYQLRHERDITAQTEAITALEGFPTPNTRSALTHIIENENAFYRIRCRATHCLTKVANAMPSWDGPPAMLVIFKRMFGSFSASNIIKQNDFSNLQNYFLQCHIPLAMGGLRNSHGICPPEVLGFLLDLFKYNDNSRNTFSDNYYRSNLVDALGETVTPVVSMLQNDGNITAENLSEDTKKVLEEITRFLNMEKLLPCYRYTVTTACLKAIRKLQKTGHLPPNPGIFKDYAKPGQFDDTRVAALECLADYIKLEGKFDDLSFVIDIIENDPVPKIRHMAVRSLIQCPPFERGRHHRNDRPELVDRLYTLINSGFWYDSRLRCDMVDLYYTLYGRRRPPTVPIPELAALGRHHAGLSGRKSGAQSSFVIPKGEKRPHSPPVQVKQEPVAIKQEPIDLDERAGAFFDQGGMEVPDFFSETPAAPPPTAEFDVKHKKHKKEKKKKKKHKHKKDKESGTLSSGASSSGSNPNSPAPDLVF